MKKFGLIGHPLSHSFSANYFNNKFKKEEMDAEYQLFPLQELSLLPHLIKNEPTLCGLNVTIPYKKKVFPYLTAVDKIAQLVGAVNTIKIIRTEPINIIGYNTDVYGFETLLNRVNTANKKALILGTGGAAAAVAYVLTQREIPFQFVSREKFSPTILSYSTLTPQDIEKHFLIINTTPLGMFPNIETKPDLDYSALTAHHTLIDLVYNPEETQFLKEGAMREATTINGMAMLIAQAEASWKIWEP
ncbi:MAG: shikimate dehydrogenase [Bacteroidales bacterium]|nr:shikimate dehydrogenase [Bacteroidales bacterium]